MAKKEETFGMSEKEVQTFLDRVHRNKIKLTGYDAQIAKKFGEAQNRVMKLRGELQQVEAQMNSLVLQIQTTKGEVNAFATLLTQSEDKRRKKTGKRKGNGTSDPARLKATQPTEEQPEAS